MLLAITVSVAISMTLRSINLPLKKSWLALAQIAPRQF